MEKAPTLLLGSHQPAALWLLHSLKHWVRHFFSSTHQASMGSDTIREVWIRKRDEKDLVDPIAHSKY